MIFSISKCVVLHLKEDKYSLKTATPVQPSLVKHTDEEDNTYPHLLTAALCSVRPLSSWGWWGCSEGGGRPYRGRWWKRHGGWSSPALHTTPRTSSLTSAPPQWHSHQCWRNKKLIGYIQYLEKNWYQFDPWLF